MFFLKIKFRGSNTKRSNRGTFWFSPAAFSGVEVHPQHVTLSGRKFAKYNVDDNGCVNNVDDDDDCTHCQTEVKHANPPCMCSRDQRPTAVLSHTYMRPREDEKLVYRRNKKKTPNLANNPVAATAVNSARGVVGANREHPAGADGNAGAEHLGVDPFGSIS